MKCPSIDREDSNGNYEFSNCRFIEKFLNNSLSSRKAIIQKSLDGKIIKEWYSLRIISKKFKYDVGNLGEAVIQKRPAYGYIWEEK